MSKISAAVVRAIEAETLPEAVLEIANFFDREVPRGVRNPEIAGALRAVITMFEPYRTLEAGEIAHRGVEVRLLDSTEFHEVHDGPYEVTQAALDAGIEYRTRLPK